MLEAEVDITIPASSPATNGNQSHEEELHPARARGARPQWEINAKERLRREIRRLLKPLAAAIARDASEGDTKMLVTDLICLGLGYDKFGDVTAEYPVKGEFADFAIRIDKQLVAFIEIKRATTRLGSKHLRQIELYAVNEGVEWLVLTNASHWLVYHLSPGMPVVLDLALHVDLLDSSESVVQKADKLFYLSRESLKRRQIDDLWKRQAATSPKQLATMLLSPSVVLALHRELRRQTRQRVEPKELTRLLRETVLRRECTD